MSDITLVTATIPSTAPVEVAVTLGIYGLTPEKIHAATEKTTLADNDEYLILDSATGYTMKRVKNSNAGGGGGTSHASLSVGSIDTEDKLVVFEAIASGVSGENLSVTIATPGVHNTTLATIANGVDLTITPGTKAKMVVTGCNPTGANRGLYHVDSYAEGEVWSSNYKLEGVPARGSAKLWYDDGEGVFVYQSTNAASAVVYQSVSNVCLITDSPATVTWNTPLFGTGTPTFTAHSSSARQCAIATNSYQDTEYADHGTAKIILATFYSTGNGDMATATIQHLSLT